MMPLHELQQRFGSALFDDDSDGLAAVIEANGMEPEARIDIYRNNLHAGFRKALALSFPVVEQLVGGGYFSQLARAYQAAHPSRCGDLHHIGKAFAGYLQARYTDGEYGYLADVAALEWAIQEIAVAERPAPATVEDLRRVAPEAYVTLRWVLHPAARLLSSRYPIVRIWLSNQPGAAPEVIDLDAGGDRLLVCEGPDGLEFHRLCEAEYALLTAWAAGLSLGPAAESALAVGDGRFDLVRALHRLLTAGALVVVP